MLDDALLGLKLSREEYDQIVPGLRTELLDLQFDLLESARFPVIILVAGYKTAGKSETIQELLGWLDPRTVQVQAETPPGPEDRERPGLFRHWRDLPPRGRIGVYYSGWYFDLFRAIAEGELRRAELPQAFVQVQRFERQLVDEGALVLKFLLHISAKERRRRLKKWAKDPHKRWWLTQHDWQLAKKGKSLHGIFERVITATDHHAAPWTIVDAGDEYHREVTVAQHVVAALRARLQAPAPAPTRPAAVPAQPPAVPNVISRLDLGQRLEEDEYERQIDKWEARLARLVQQPGFQRRSVCAVFEGTDAAGKGGAIRRITNAIDARIHRVVRIAKPTDEEAAQPWMWRFWRHLPRRGHLTIFDRSWYGRVLVERVEGFCQPHEWQRAFDEIKDFETTLLQAGVVVVKQWLQISKEEQLRRFEARRDTPYKRQKLTDEDWRNREKWDEYQAAVVDMIQRTSTADAPWTLVEAEDKLFARVKVLKTLCKAIEAAL
ncbi:MAG: polyphosphate:AMP phosphotransferase [Planctomycetes bacterium]|nr:polyphosphate:AMP phosphotransferase [Planctomycetota bacterium]